jgi:hypothetical protein
LDVGRFVSFWCEAAFVVSVGLAAFFLAASVHDDPLHSGIRGGGPEGGSLVDEFEFGVGSALAGLAAVFWRARPRR